MGIRPSRPRGHAAVSLADPQSQDLEFSKFGLIHVLYGEHTATSYFDGCGLMLELCCAVLCCAVLCYARMPALMHLQSISVHVGPAEGHGAVLMLT